MNPKRVYFSGLMSTLGCSVRAVQSDEYGAYDIFDRLSGYLHLCCWAHVRRKFIEAESYDPPNARHLINQISLLYDIEKTIKENGFKEGGCGQTASAKIIFHH